ncbi:hypothetical protein K402DRAFT_366761 [Aulographum hederae CBS 113979]|uniref:SEC7 domain-containing protein n=1 Tax=Aulographum hederae CBS 113979 TaxID=1176131 RepID=A0A6G1HH68_9PEZI|nr:hypothetical protein K402DRAFT_366761 [Aulographum hederae CBS 113979]
MAEPEIDSNPPIEAAPTQEQEDQTHTENGIHREPQHEEAPEAPVIITTEEETSPQQHPPPPPQTSEPPTPSATSTQMISPSTPDVNYQQFPSESRIPSTPRLRTDSQSTSATATTTRAPTRSSLVFVVTALETIAASKDARKRKALADSVQKALTAIKGDTERMSPETLFEPLQLATEASTVQVVTTALDCIGKLISYSYFSTPADSTSSDAPPLIERAIDTICDCFQSEATPVETQLQIVKSLLAAILNDKIVVHGAGLLKAVRLTYNIFLLSKSSANQQVAQGALTQMVGTVFERVKSRLAIKEARVNGSKLSLARSDSDDGIPARGSVTAVDGSIITTEDDGDVGVAETDSNAPNDLPVEKEGGPKITLQSFENRKSFDDAKIADNAPTLVTRVKGRPKPSRTSSGNELQASATLQNGESDEEEEDEIFMKDAYLVFRAMCRLSVKTVPLEHVQDVKSQSMRSKLLSLHIVHTILHNHISVFASPLATIRNSATDEPTSFVQAIKQYLCLSLSRNGASSLSHVFEVSCEIFWLMLKHLRMMLKKEIEVFMKEIYLAILEKRAAPSFQKQYILMVFRRLGTDPRALIEIYLNYDCDRTALDNMFERIVEHLSRISSTPVVISAIQQQAFNEQQTRSPSVSSDWHTRGTLPPSLATAAIHSPSENDQGYPAEYAMKQESLEALVEVLRSLVNWAQSSMVPADTAQGLESRNSVEDYRVSMGESLDTRETGATSPQMGAPETGSGNRTPLPDDDPGQFEREKQRKTAMTNAIRHFNFKPKRGIKTLLSEKIIPSDSPQDIAKFLISNPLLNKATLGEYLGEGEPENIAIMHAFVDEMDFHQSRFVDALRRFLQSFRLPGEAQKIDRFMMKFAERYCNGNPKAFANAETAYVLSYSVILLNTDQHSLNMKGKRMDHEDFIKNNRGINDGGDLPREYLIGIYDEINKNEIILNSERETAANLGIVQQQPGGIAATIGNALSGRDLRKEASAQASQEIANKTEHLYKSLLRSQRRKMTVSKFVPATSFKHVGPMFLVTWTPFLTALSGQAQDTHNLETIKLCMEGLKLAIRIACIFDLEDPRQAFVASLARFTNLYNLSEMKAKNVEALKVLIEVAQVEGNHLKESWRDILTCISQLDRFQLLSVGVGEDAVPDLQRRTQPKSRPGPGQRRSNLQVPSRRARSGGSISNFQSDIAEESRSADMVRGVDRVFTNTANLSGDAIVYFVRALTQVSWQEIQSSGNSNSPRTYSLQKLVEISGYNMTRVRFEWSNIWQVLGQHFIEVGCHTNTAVVEFALNSLRQLSMKFMEIPELPGFKFQKDFLKPFEHIMKNTTVVTVKDMVLRCLIQMIQARGQNIRSGWRTMFGVFTVAAQSKYEGIVYLAYENVTQVYNNRFGVVISQGAFADLIVCFTEFAKNMSFQKKSLQAIETLKFSVPKMLRTPECPLSARTDEKKKDPSQSDDLPKQPTQQTQEEQFWFPVLFAFHDVLMTGEDLEVRSRALNYLFDTLISYGADFPRGFWDTLWRQLLYPIFMVLKSKSEMSKVVNHEETSVWLSTTMIQALRHMITLFTHFFASLEYMLNRFLELLALCICQENDTLARIGSNCLQQLILQNVTKFQPAHWEQIVGAFVELFQRTEATALFSSIYTQASTPTNGMKSPRGPEGNTQNLSDLPLSHAPDDDEPNGDSAENALGINGLPSHRRSSTVASDSVSSIAASSTNIPPAPTDLEDYNPGSPSTLQTTPIPVSAARRKLFNQIITKCVLQLLMIETVNELFSNDAVYTSIPSPELLRLMALLKKSYHFAKRFNADRELRTRLFREGFMKQPPNLLKQESGSAAVYVAILFRMYHDSSTERAANRLQTEQALIPLCEDIVSSYNDLDDETQQRNVQTWRPVVVDVLEGYAGFPKEEFVKNLSVFAPLVVGLLGREMGMELQRAVQGLVGRIFEVGLGVEVGGLGVVGPGTPTAERRGSSVGAGGGGGGFGRRGSRQR